MTIWETVCKPGMFVRSGYGSASTKGNKQAAAREEKWLCVMM